jgi:aminopeptidase N
MLRTLLTDHDTGDDSAFTTVMNTFYTRYLGRAASTRAFQQVVEEVVGVDMGWFFDQWVYRSAIPTYTFSSTLADQPDGTVKATVRVRQEDVPEDFRMLVPILLDFGAQGTAVVQIDVQGPLTEADLPPLPMRPRAIVFNPYESVLAETPTEDWRK